MEMLGQRARIAQEVKDQGRQQLRQGCAGFASTWTVATARQRQKGLGKVNSPRSASVVYKN